MSAQADHIINTGRFGLALRIKQLILACAVLGLTAYLISYISYNVYAFGIATAVISIIVSIYYFVSALATPKAYNAWAVLSLDILMVILWLVAFALNAALAASWTSGTCYSYYYGYYSCYSYGKRDLVDLEKRDTTVEDYWGSMIGVAVVAALEFVLFLIHLIFFSVRLHRHRKANAPLTYTGNFTDAHSSVPPPVYSTTPAATATTGGVPLEKIDHTQVQQQAVPHQQQQQQQPVQQTFDQQHQYQQQQNPIQPISPQHTHSSYTTYTTSASPPPQQQFQQQQPYAPSPVQSNAPTPVGGYYTPQPQAGSSELPVHQQHQQHHQQQQRQVGHPGVSELGSYRGA